MREIGLRSQRRRQQRIAYTQKLGTQSEQRLALYVWKRLSKNSQWSELVIRPFNALPESASLQTLKANIDSRLPEIPLTELLLEINARTNFAIAIKVVTHSVAWAFRVHHVA